MKNIKTNYLIIGQGIAGTFFAHELTKANKSFVIIDPNTHNASKTAAGMYNPVILKRFSPVWQAQTQIDTARRIVSELEQQFNTKFDYPLPIHRIFHDQNERKVWAKKALDKELCSFLNQQYLLNYNSHIHAPFDLGEVKHGGRIDLSSMLSAYRNYLNDKDQIITENFEYDKLIIENDFVKYKNIKAKHIIFCEGYGIKENPFFNYLPLNGNKGEVLIVRIKNLNIDSAIKSSVFIMPLPEYGKDIYFIGATYNWTDKDGIPSNEAREELLNKLSTFIEGNVEVLEHRAGIRPTVSDRRPLVGQHPCHNRLYIMNGLGTRGVMLGAAMAQNLYHYINDGEELPSEVNCQRFNAK